MMPSLFILILLWLQAAGQPPAAPPPPAPAPGTAQGAAESPSEAVDARAARTASIARDCAALLGADTSLAPLAPLCNSALAYSFTLPNFICDQHIDRHVSITSYGFLPAPDVITAQVTFQDGVEHYSNISLNGSPVRGGLLDLRGMDSVGEFGSLLSGIFKPREATRFVFRKEAKVQAVDALIYEYHITSENNHMWHWLEDGHEVAPAIGGEVWVEKATGTLRRFLIQKEPGGPKTLTDNANITIEYADVQLGEAGTFRLPSRSEVVACGHGRCNRNLLRFANCHKFVARGRLILEPEK